MKYSNIKPKDYTSAFLKGEFGKSILKDEELEYIVKKFNMPEGYTFRKAGEDETPLTPPRPNELCLYWDHVRLGMTFDLLGVVGDILNSPQFTLPMMTPNCIYIILTLHKYFQRQKVEWNHDIFLYLFGFTPFSHYVGCRPRSTSLFKISGMASSIHWWKVRFFYVCSPTGWNLLSTPGLVDGDIISRPSCPESLQNWFNSHPQVSYLLNSETLNMKQIRPRLQKYKEEKSGEGRHAENTPPAKRQKFDEVEESSSGSSDSDSDSAARSTSKASNNTGKNSEEIDVTTISADPPPTKENIGTSKASKGKKPYVTPNIEYDDGELPPYYKNEEGILMLRPDGDVPLLEFPIQEFGLLLSQFTRSETEIAGFKRLKSSDMMKLYHSMVLSVGRMGSFLNEKSSDHYNSAALWRKEFEKLETIHQESLKKVEDYEEKIKHLIIERSKDAITITKLEKDSHLIDEALSAAVASDKEHLSENEKLKAALAEKEAENVELKRKLAENASGSRELTAKEQLKSLEDTDAYADDMASFLNQGFESCQRGATRHLKDSASIEIIQQLNFRKCNAEDIAECLGEDV